MKHNRSTLSALISTIEPIDGGVPSMTKWVCSLLRDLNILPTIVWYAPWRNYPSLSVPLYSLFRRSPGYTSKLAFNMYSGYGVGSWCPEFELTHYLPNKIWRRLSQANDLHIVVSGNTLAATPFYLMGLQYISWVATPWEADRKDRVEKYSIQRQLFDAFFNRPAIKRLERKILENNQSTVLALSKYTSTHLEEISNKKVDDILLMPVDTDIYRSDNSRVIPWRIGFSGRYCDPRKNIDLLFRAARQVLDKDIPIEVILVGDKDSKQIEERIRDYGLSSCVVSYQHMNPIELSSLLQTLDVFVIPSHQEGLCISALEAMACGVPVISTRCGGPEQYVIHLETGELVEMDPTSLSQTIMQICGNRQLRAQLSCGAQKWIANNASKHTSRKIFEQHLQSLIIRSRLEDRFEEGLSRL